MTVIASMRRCPVFYSWPWFRRHALQRTSAALIDTRECHWAPAARARTNESRECVLNTQAAVAVSSRRRPATNRLAATMTAATRAASQTSQINPRVEPQIEVAKRPTSVAIIKMSRAVAPRRGVNVAVLAERKSIPAAQQAATKDMPSAEPANGDHTATPAKSPIATDIQPGASEAVEFVIAFSDASPVFTRFPDSM